MEIVIFENQSWDEIPKEQNPTYIYNDNDRSLGRPKESIVICKTFARESVGKNGYIAIKVPLSGEIERLGMFWKLAHAQTFARSYIVTVEKKEAEQTKQFVGVAQLIVKLDEIKKEVYEYLNNNVKPIE